MSTMRKKSVFLEDVVVAMADEVSTVVKNYVESHEGVNYTDVDLHAATLDFIEKVTNVQPSEDERLSRKVQWALDKFNQARRGRGGTPRQYAVALFNAVYDYISLDLDLDDEELDRKVIEEIENLGVDYGEMNELIESIY